VCESSYPYVAVARKDRKRVHSFNILRYGLYSQHIKRVHFVNILGVEYIIVYQKSIFSIPICGCRKRAHSFHILRVHSVNILGREYTSVYQKSTLLEYPLHTHMWLSQKSTPQECVAVCCSVLQCVAVCCSVLQCVAVCCSVLHTYGYGEDTLCVIDDYEISVLPCIWVSIPICGCRKRVQHKSAPQYTKRVCSSYPYVAVARKRVYLVC